MTISRKCSLFSFLLLFGLAMISAKTSLADDMADLETTAAPAIRPPVLYSGFTDPQLVATPLTLGEAQSWFSTLAARTDIPYQFVFDGCYARAEEIAKTLDDNGIISLKLYIVADPEGNTFQVHDRFNPSCLVAWVYHVTVAVLVINPMNPTGYELMVMDPSLFDQPVDADVWTQEIGQTNGGNFFAHYEPRFAYQNNEPFSYSWNSGDLTDMDATNQAHLGQPSQCNSSGAN